MTSDALEKLRAGHAVFHDTIYAPHKDNFDALLKAQSPKILVIACCDSRVDPSIIVQSNPGDIFMVRNVANLVPPFECPSINTSSSTDGHRGTSTALEYGVFALNVEHIIVLGHWGCGGIEALVRNDPAVSEQFPFVHNWISMAREAADVTMRDLPDASLADQCRKCERESIHLSLENLMTFPWIADRVNAGTLQLHGWFFDLPSGHLLSLNPETNTFERILEAPA